MFCKTTSSKTFFSYWWKLDGEICFLSGTWQCKLHSEHYYITLINVVHIEYFCTFTRVKLKKQYFYFYWSNILLYVSVLLLKYLICVLCPPLSKSTRYMSLLHITHFNHFVSLYRCSNTLTCIHTHFHLCSRLSDKTRSKHFSFYAFNQQTRTRLAVSGLVTLSKRHSARRTL